MQRLQPMPRVQLVALNTRPMAVMPMTEMDLEDLNSFVSTNAYGGIDAWNDGPMNGPGMGGYPGGFGGWGGGMMGGGFGWGGFGGGWGW